MKKKILIFILCFTLIFTTSIYQDKNIQVVKANPALAVSFITLALTSMGVTYYYQNTQNSLQNDIEVYCRDTNQNYTTWIGTFGNIVVDVGKKVVKYSAAQIYALKNFVNYLINNNKVSYVPITSSSFEYVPLFGYPCLMKVHSGDSLNIVGEDGDSCIVRIESTGNGDVYLGFTVDWANESGDAVGLCISPNSASVRFHVVYSDGTVGSSTSLSYPNYIDSIDFVDLDTFYSTGNPFVYLIINGIHIYNCYYLNSSSKYPTNYIFSTFYEQCKLRFGFDTTNSIYQGLVLPNYAVNRSVFNTADDTKPLVVSAPEVIDKAVDIAVGANPDATAVSLGDVAIAIDDTAVGLINPAAEDDDEKVIAPDLSLPLDITQDLAVSDTITEDLVITDPLPPPDPPIPDIDIELGSKFPFSVFYDFVAIMNLFDADPIAPSFPLGFEFLGNYYEFTVDLSDFDSVARILRLMELIAFISGLVILTIKYIRGKD